MSLKNRFLLLKTSNGYSIWLNDVNKLLFFFLNCNLSSLKSSQNQKFATNIHMVCGLLFSAFLLGFALSVPAPIPRLSLSSFGHAGKYSATFFTVTLQLFTALTKVFSGCEKIFQNPDFYHLNLFLNLVTFLFVMLFPLLNFQSPQLW